MTIGNAKVDLNWEYLKFEPGEDVTLPLHKNAHGLIYTIDYDKVVYSFPAKDFYMVENAWIPIISIFAKDESPVNGGQKVCNEVQVFKNTLLEHVGDGPGIKKYLIIREDLTVCSPVGGKHLIFGDFGFAIYARKRRTK